MDMSNERRAEKSSLSAILQQREDNSMSNAQWQQLHKFVRPFIYLGFEVNNTVELLSEINWRSKLAASVMKSLWRTLCTPDIYLLDIICKDLP